MLGAEKGVDNEEGPLLYNFHDYHAFRSDKPVFCFFHPEHTSQAAHRGQRLLRSCASLSLLFPPCVC